MENLSIEELEIEAALLHAMLMQIESDQREIQIALERIQAELERRYDE